MQILVLLCTLYNVHSTMYNIQSEACPESFFIWERFHFGAEIFSSGAESRLKRGQNILLQLKTSFGVCPLCPMRAFFISGRNILFRISSGAQFEGGICPRARHAFVCNVHCTLHCTSFSIHPSFVKTFHYQVDHMHNIDASFFNIYTY